MWSPVRDLSSWPTWLGEQREVTREEVIPGELGDQVRRGQEGPVNGPADWDSVKERRTRE
jgi:hypothetical protein